MSDNNLSLVEVLKKIKSEYEEAIISGGNEATLSLIRSKKLISHLHEYIKRELINNSVSANKICPPLNQTSPELKVAGFLKEKNQDIMVLPFSPLSETITEGVLKGDVDKYGKENLNKSLCINLRSQLSSLSKNFDTLYERTFAEPLNLHLRFPKMVMGEIYMVPLYAYDTVAIKQRKLNFTGKLAIVKYFRAFQELNGRKNFNSDFHKYERVCLLIVDFMQDTPTIIDSISNLALLGFINKEDIKAFKIENLTINNFIRDILDTYKSRHGTLSLLS